MTHSQRLHNAQRGVLSVIGVLVVCLSFAIHGLAQPTKQTPLSVRQKTLEVVWKTVNDNYFDPRFGGIDWADIKKRYEPQVTAVQSDAEFQDLLERMLHEIK